MTEEQEIIFLRSRVMLQQLKIKALLQVGEDLATAIIEVDPDSTCALGVMKEWERIRDWVNQ